MNPMQQYMLHLQEELEDKLEVEQADVAPLELEVITPGALSAEEKQALVIEPSVGKGATRPASAYFLYKKTKEEREQKASDAKHTG